MNLTSNDIKSHAKDFTIDHYRKLLLIAKENYQFIFYNEVNFQEKSILWRHDCDYSLNRAYYLGKIENSLNVKSTFFINPHC